uniref:Coatomer subunit gamma n=1 Tax=Blastobotrys adeninivorans TaxID=409370 RepID=A0A060T9K5_BLAAD
MSALTYKKNEDLESGSLDKMTVYQECLSGFNASPIQSKRCRALLAKLIHLLSTGETFPPEEATTLFFSVTKLFQHKDPSLRQMVYLAIKELSTVANDVIMVTSSIMKDIQGSNENIYKPNAIRALVRIIDASIVQGIERLMKTAIVDKHAGISSAGLVSSYHLVPIARDVVRRWANETQEAVLAKKKFPESKMEVRYSSGMSYMAQYHALGLLYQLRSHDKMALMKMIHHFFDNSYHLHSSNAIVMLIRYVAKIIDQDPSLTEQMLPILRSWLRHKSDIVNLEVCKAILQVKDVGDAPAGEAIEVLRNFLGSPRTVARFSAIRILNRFAMTRPQAVVNCNLEIEALINDSSRSISTYAITTLLKTGNEASVDRLMGQISGFMNDISDEFKIIVVDAIRSLALKFPAKHATMLSFLAGTLRNEGGVSFKTAVVEALFDMITYIPESRDEALGHLCEFIEDCEYTQLTVRILHLLGQEGPKTAVPTLYIRYIYNRVVLENAVIRAAAVSALVKFALVDDLQVKKSIKVLLTRCLDDVTDEVRDRAALGLKLLDLEPSTAATYVAPEAKYSIPQLEHQLAIYVSGGREAFEKPFDITSVKVITEEEARAQALEQKRAKHEREPTKESDKSEKAKPSAANKDLERDLQQQKYSQALSAIPEIASYGPLLKSTGPVPLTESETEYVVSAVKHVFKEHLVVQYDVTNTFPEYALENVYAEVDSELEEEFMIPIDRLVPDSTGSIYVSFSRPEELITTTIVNGLKFVSKEIDPETKEVAEDGFEEDYSVEDLEIGAGDYLSPAFVGSFDHQWDELAASENSATYQLASVSSIADAVSGLVDALSLAPLEGTDIPSSETSHTLKLFGRTISSERVAALIKMVYSSRSGVTLKVTARAETDSTAAMVVDSVGSL